MLSLLAAVAGCGFGAGPSSSGTATLAVTRDYGSETLLDATEEDPAESETVIRLLDREAEISTRYGGGFVQSIGGLAGAERGGRRYDWFFYVNGVESSVGAADVHLRGGDRIWWDYRDWTDAMRVPAVVGSWPEPFAQASSDPSERRTVPVECGGPRAACAAVADRVRDAGPRVAIMPVGSKRARSRGGSEILVGPWGTIRSDPNASLQGPADSGVFATFKPRGHGRFELVLSDPGAEPRCGYRAGAGLVAAVEAPGGGSTWLVTGTDAAGVSRAAGLLDARDLRDHYAVAAPAHGPPLSAPVVAEDGDSAPCGGESG
jgi:hypothetical protein